MTEQPADGPHPLVEVLGDAPAAGELGGAAGGGPVLVLALDGFVDAGSAARLARDHLLTALQGRVVARFDADELVDYRARRPPMMFVEDHWESYEDPSLAVHLLTDEAGTDFLLLAGPEPDYRWESFVAGLASVVRRFGVRLTIGLNAIPMAVPHTRPVGVIAHGSRKELVEGWQPWVGTVAVPSSAAHLAEFRLAAGGLDTMGFAANVPHYVAQSAYPAAAATLLDAVAGAAGLALPTGALTEAAEAARTEIDATVAASPDVLTAVKALEEQYDTVVAARGTLLQPGSSRLPSGDELGAEFERFLREQTPPGEEGKSPDG